MVIQLNGGFNNKRKPPAPPGTSAEVGETVTCTSVDPKAMPSVLPAEEDTPSLDPRRPARTLRTD
ncbi:hypothetical protein ACFYRD_04160 [Streptomyces hirsutus]|uniref:hypothetical protein n=1 Tax=Streptomyces hirsutus TaxID=35620 RepID=UPI00367974BB